MFVTHVRWYFINVIAMYRLQNGLRDPASSVTPCSEPFSHAGVNEQFGTHNGDFFVFHWLIYHLMRDILNYGF